ncbi:MAG: c-type cytochrome [Rhodobacteraceae bacterium]|nr:c-type cytochrome [Paracoccaceae bacterium]
MFTSLQKSTLVALFFATTASAQIAFSSIESFGEALFFDTNLSANRTQSCATCHDPANGFVDARAAMPGNAFSLGDDGHSFGDRNAPTAAYAMFSPPFGQTDEGYYIGGQFLDGREADLEGQAGGPPLNPIEMGMPDKASIVARLTENPDYVVTMQALFGAEMLAQPEAAYAAMAASIAAFERTDEFAPFDSKYDRYLSGDYTLTNEEELGRLLFFSEQFTNCNQCHQLHSSQLAAQETFTDYRYYNIGVPSNVAGREINGVDVATVDHGLLGNPAVNNPAEDGKFRTPTLRNIAVTGPYMHNGVFTDLRTVILFYNKYNSRSEARQINPETGATWAAPEVPATVELDILNDGPALEDQRIDAIVAFLKTLTDARYEDLIVP